MVQRDEATHLHQLMEQRFPVVNQGSSGKGVVLERVVERVWVWCGKRKLLK